VLSWGQKGTFGIYCPKAKINLLTIPTHAALVEYLAMNSFEESLRLCARITWQLNLYVPSKTRLGLLKCSVRFIAKATVFGIPSP